MVGFNVLFNNICLKRLLGRAIKPEKASPLMGLGEFGFGLLRRILWEIRKLCGP